MVKALDLSHLSAASTLHQASFDKGWNESDLKPHIERDLCLGVFEGRGLQAFVIISIAADQSEILTIAVSPEHRKKGLAKALLGAAHNILAEKGVNIIFLEVAIDNIAAKALYRYLGYEPFGTRPAYYKRPKGRVAAALFRKKLG